MCDRSCRVGSVVGLDVVFCIQVVLGVAVLRVEVVLGVQARVGVVVQAI